MSIYVYCSQFKNDVSPQIHIEKKNLEKKYHGIKLHVQFIKHDVTHCKIIFYWQFSFKFEIKTHNILLDLF